MASRRGAAALGLLTALASATGAARAQQPAEPQVAEPQVAEPQLAERPTAQPGQRSAEQAAMARALFREGVAEAHEQRFEIAADRFRRAQLLRPAPGIAYNLASALVHLGRLVEASEQLEWVVRHESCTEELRASASEMIRRIEPRLARARVVLDGPIEGVELTLDGQPLPLAALLDVSVPMDPGSRVLVALRGGERLRELALELAEGAEEEIRLSIPPVVPEAIAPPTPSFDPLASPPERETPPPVQDDLSWLLWTGLAVGALAVAVTTTALIAAPQNAPPPIEGTTFPPVLEWD